ncbi:MAG: DNA polymerase I [Thermoflexales bacterium]|nr:DNA polymerase I [Thermoflexales bacterium]
MSANTRSRPRLVLLDGHALAYRAYYAMLNTKGEPLAVTHPDGRVELTGAVYAFTNMLIKVWRELQPDYIAIAFDVGRTFRDDLYADYKATRDKMPDDLAAQMRRIQQVVNAFEIPVFTAEGYEADDVIGTLARRASGEGFEVIIVTGDRDALQLVSPAVKVLASRQRFEDTMLYDEAAVQAALGVQPEQVVDFKALVGDASDNIPGVRGIGEKTAQHLLQRFGSLDGIYAHLDQVEPKRVRALLEQGRESAYLSRELARIKTDVPLEVDWEACRADLGAINLERVNRLFQELGFNTSAKRFEELRRALAPESPPAPSGEPQQMGLFGALEVAEPLPKPGAPTRTRIVRSDEDYRALLTALHNAQRIAFDTETSTPDPLNGELVGLSFCVREGEGWYVPVSGASWTLDPRSLKFEPIRHALMRPEVQLVAHNAKFDLEALQQAGVSLSRPIFDTMIAQYLCEPSGRSLGLKSLAYSYFGWQMTEIAELIGKGKHQLSMRDVPLESIAPYAAADADATFRLVDVLTPLLRERNQERLFYEVELPLIHVLVDMEVAGVAVDVRYLGELAREITERLRALERTIFEIAGLAFNINSPKQLSDVLFGKLGLPTQGAWKTSSGVYSTSAEVLEALRDKHEIIPYLLEHRELSKLLGTYVEALPKLVNPRTGRIHTDFNQTGTVTGRLSSSNPNLQNIPIKTEMGRRVRKAFVPRPGWRLISADYSQVELRILAHLADDPTLKAAFARDEDIHAATASVIYGVPLSEVTPMQRNNAKRINFGIAYGMGAYALAQNTGMSVSEAQAFIERYFARFPKVKQWLDDTKRMAAERGYVETVMGRRRYFPELRAKDTNEQLRRRAEREAINHPVQGSAADIIKIAMIRIHQRLNSEGFQCRMTLQVHDELVFDCPPTGLEAAKALIREEMERAFPLSVRLKADVASGPNWDEVA